MSSRTYPRQCCRAEPTRFYVRLLRRGPNTFHAFCWAHLPRGGHQLVVGSNWMEITKEEWLAKQLRPAHDPSQDFASDADPYDMLTDEEKAEQNRRWALNYLSGCKLTVSSIPSARQAELLAGAHYVLAGDHVSANHPGRSMGTAVAHTMCVDCSGRSVNGRCNHCTPTADHKYVYWTARAERAARNQNGDEFPVGLVIQKPWDPK